jgi:hypothetical protein
MDRMSYRPRKIINDGKNRASIFVQIQLTKEEVSAVKELASTPKARWRPFIQALAQEAIEKAIRST